MTTVGERSFDESARDYDNDSYDEVILVKENERPSQQEINLVSATPKELLVYFANRFKETQGFEYNVEWVKEMAIFKSFKERYGEDAGPMVALLFDKYNCVINGDVMTATAFTQGAKWIQDKLYIELKKDTIRENTPGPSTEGLMRTDEFFKRFAV
jgi:hypothetical protein